MLNKSEIPLTSFDAAFDQRVIQTVPGQAHFAGTGPLGKFCSDCASWAIKARYEKQGKACLKFQELMGKKGPPIPARTRACGHFK